MAHGAPRGRRTPRRTTRWLVVGLLASASAGLLTLPSMLNTALAFGDDDNVALIMGGTGLQGGTLPSGLPTADFVSGAVSLYIDPGEPYFSGQPVFSGFTTVPLATPEQDAPYTGTLTISQSIAQGVTDLNTAITQTYAGDDIVVLGYSQSATVATLEMNALIASGQGPNPADLQFVLLGDNNPESGLSGLENAFLNFPNMPYIPSVATDPDTPYPTDIYTIQYDGLSDFCQYPINLLCDVNAGMGMAYLHPTYATLTPEQLASAVELPTSPGYYADGGVTNYYLIPTQTLPLLEPLQQIEQALPTLQPVIQPFIDLIQPDLTYLVNLGYEDPYTAYANVPATPSLFPDINPITFAENLGQDTMNGINAALAYEGLPQISDAGVPELLAQASQLIPGLPNLTEPTGQLGGDIFSSVGSDLSPLMADLSAGPVGQAVTELGVDVAYLAATLG
jgi:hypothetical protein